MPSPTKDFYLDPGTSGFITAAFTALSTELNSLAAASTCTSSVGGTSGVFSQTNFTNALLCEVFFIAGGTFTATAGANIAGWWLKSTDGGSTFERANITTGLPRPPDFIIPLYAQAYSANDISFGVVAAAPWPSCKVEVLNGAGVALPSSNNVIKIAPVGWGY